MIDDFHGVARLLRGSQQVARFDRTAGRVAPNPNPPAQRDEMSGDGTVTQEDNETISVGQTPMLIAPVNGFAP